MTKNTVQKTASLDERTVQKVASESLTIKSNGRGPTKHRLFITTKDEHVDPRVLEAAKELAQGDLGRIKIVSSVEVIVYNSSELRAKASK